MDSLPVPLDNPTVLLAVIVGLCVLVYAVMKAQKAKKQLAQTRANKDAARKARLKAKRADTETNTP